MPDHPARRALRHPLRWAAWRLSWWRWYLSGPFTPGDPSLGQSREERDRNIRLMQERHDRREPRWPEW